MNSESVYPAVSIILPTYNRARFLPQAFESICSQTLSDWELIIVDDGSTDNTRELVAELAKSIVQPVRYVYQENQGAYGARNTGLDHAQGRYIAFFDSDDIWLPHHLADCAAALEQHPEVDWVYGACRIVQYDTKQELSANTFYEDGKPRPFQRLRTRSDGRLRIIDDSAAARCQILHGLYCGLQNSVIRTRLFDGYRFASELRNEAEDQVIVIWALASGFRFAYFDHVHVVYHVHDANSSLAGAAKAIDKRLRLQLAVIEGFRRLSQMSVLQRADRRALKRRLSEEYFWQVGYSLLWMNGRRAEALPMMRRGLAYRPWNWRYWKTYSLAVSRAGTPETLKRSWWWLSDEKWRKENREVKQRIAKFHHLQRLAVREIIRQKGDRVLCGPFRGLSYTPAATVGSGAHVLLGTYEKELHPILEELCHRKYKTVIDIGASEGYYLCGFALRSRADRIIGFELNLKKHSDIKKLTEANGVEERIQLFGACDANSLRRVLDGKGQTLVICDVDGAEIEILDPNLIPSLSDVDILVETHDLIRSGITEELIRRFTKSHAIDKIDSKRRIIEDVPTGIVLAREIALSAMDEFRGGDQSWLWLQSKLKADTVVSGNQIESTGLSAVT